MLYEVITTIRQYRPSTDLSMIEKAYKVASDAHTGQLRKSGEPYIIHPLSVAIILAELELDKETIVAGILHDIIEDTNISEAEVAKEFGEEVLLLVDGVTKLTQMNYSTDKIEIQAENLRKMFLAMAKDIRVILIKLADRLHNMRTIVITSYSIHYTKLYDMKDLSEAAFGNLFDYPEDLLELASECGMRSFVIMAGCLDGLLPTTEKLSYEGPFGVGYGVVAFRNPVVSENRQFDQIYEKRVV